MDNLLAELTALRARVEALEADRGRVCAPFRVVDDAGRTLFAVELDAEEPDGPVIGVRVFDRRSGEVLLQIQARESVTDGLNGTYPGAAMLQIGSGTEIDSGSLVLTGREHRPTGHVDQIVLEALRGPHIDLYLGEAGELPMVEIHARDYESGMHVSRGDFDQGDWNAECRGIFLGTAPQSRQPVLTLWNRNDQPVVELTANDEGRVTLSDQHGVSSLVLPAPEL